MGAIGVEPDDLWRERDGRVGSFQPGGEFPRKNQAPGVRADLDNAAAQVVLPRRVVRMRLGPGERDRNTRTKALQRSIELAGLRQPRSDGTWTSAASTF
jgi:hypothetical protein